MDEPKKIVKPQERTYYISMQFIVDQSKAGIMCTFPMWWTYSTYTFHYPLKKRKKAPLPGCLMEQEVWKKEYWKSHEPAVIPKRTTRKRWTRVRGYAGVIKKILAGNIFLQLLAVRRLAGSFPCRYGSFGERVVLLPGRRGKWGEERKVFFRRRFLESALSFPTVLGSWLPEGSTQRFFFLLLIPVFLVPKYYDRSQSFTAISAKRTQF